MLATKNILGENHDLWEINTDQEYQEEITQHDVKAEKIIGKKPAISVSDEFLIHAFARMDKIALATTSRVNNSGGLRADLSPSTHF